MGFAARLTNRAKKNWEIEGNFSGRKAYYI